MKFVKSAALAIAVLLLVQATASAQPASETASGAAYAAPFSNLRSLSVGLVIIGASLGIGGLTRSAVESIARQPEMAADIRTSMIISAALIEGVTFFALIIIGFIIAA